MRIVRRFLTGGTLGTLLALSMSAAPAQAAAKYVVDDGNINCVAGSGVADFTSVNAAVTFAQSHNVHTILVCPGTYDESVFINGFHTLKLAAARQTTFDRPVIRPPGGSNGGIIVYVINKSTGITLDGLILDGSTFQEPSSAAMAGILVSNSNVTIQNTNIGHIRNDTIASSLDGIGILAAGSIANKRYSLTLRHNYIFDYQTHGVQIIGGLKANILDNRIDGENNTTPPRTNGVWFQATSIAAPKGSISRNVIQGSNTSVRIEETSKISVTGNELEQGVLIWNHCSFAGAAANNNRVTGNTISHTGAGVNVFTDIDGTTVSGCNPTANDTLIQQNTVSASHNGGSYGFNLHADFPSGGHTAQVKGAKIRKNKLFGFCCLAFVTEAAASPSIGGNFLNP